MNASHADWPNDRPALEIDCTPGAHRSILDTGTRVDRCRTASRLGGARRCVALALAVALGGSAQARASAPGDATLESAPPASGPKIDLDLSGLEPIDPSVRADIAKQIRAAVEPVVQAHALPADKIHLDVAWRDADAFDYIVEIAFDADGEMEAKQHGLSTGPNTEQGELAEVIAAGLERYLAEWDDARVQADSDAVTPAPPSETLEPVDVPPPRRLGRVGWTGVGLVIAGVGAAATGGALVGIGETPDPDRATKLRDWKPAGYGLLASGGALLLTGIVLVVVDAVPRARARRSRGDRRTSIVPAFGPRHAGVHLSISF
jgi:hypothetical protein